MVPYLDLAEWKHLTNVGGLVVDRLTSEVVMRGLARLLRILGAAVAVVGLGCVTAPNNGSAHAAGYETLMVPSPAMGRDIPVAFMAGGPHAVYLLDPFDAGADVSNWVTAGNAMNTLTGKGISVVAPAGGAYSMYTDWEQDGSRQWDTFLSSELPDWLAANKGLAPGGHAAVGASQGGYGAIALATFHPDRFRYAGSMSGFLAPERTGVDGAITAGLQQYGGVDTRNMWGLPQLGRWKWHSPYVHAKLLADSNIRLWVFSPQSTTASDPAAMIGYPEIAHGTNTKFHAQYVEVGGHNGHFDFPAGGDHGWSTWAPQLGVMSGDLATAIR
jgi:S-formylglutathione hydrolase FrmB